VDRTECSSPPKTWKRRHRPTARRTLTLAQRVQRAKAHCTTTPAELAADADALDLVSFNLMLAVQCSADIASHIIADEVLVTKPSIAGHGIGGHRQPHHR
jgi:hypothetical protein